MNARRARFTPDILLEGLSGHRCEGIYQVAFSGGADSTALLLGMHELESQLKAPLAAIHVNHGRHADADQWQCHCERLCRRIGVPLATHRLAAGPGEGSGPEDTLRRERYAAFEHLLGAGDTLLQAHHLDDQAETLLLNLMRASGVEGLAGIPQARPLGRGYVLRPLLSVNRSALVEFLKSRDMDWIEDSSNRDESLDRNFLRHQVLPLLHTRWPAASRSLARSAELCREAAEALGQANQDWLQARCRDGRVLELQAGDLEDDAALRRGVREWLTASGCPQLPATRIGEFTRQLAEGGPGAMAEATWDGWSLRYFGNRLWLHRKQDLVPCPTLNWSSGSDLRLGDSLGSVALQGGENPAWRGAVSVGPAKPGQRLRLAAGNPRQKIKELLRLAGVPPWLRQSIPVISQGSDVLAVGDWLLAASLAEHFSQPGVRLVWRPAEPTLAWLRAVCHRDTG